MSLLRLNVSTKAFALIGAALLLLDFAATAIVSAAASAMYLSGEIPSLPFPTWAGAIIILVLFTIFSLIGVRESSRIALTVLFLHVRTFPFVIVYLILHLQFKLMSMMTLVVASCIHWGQTGVGQLKTNWENGKSQSLTAGSVAKQLFHGICLGMLGLTGFECNIYDFLTYPLG